MIQSDGSARRGFLSTQPFSVLLACRYMYTHGHNISLVDLVDKIASPLVKEAMLHRTYKKLDSWPTPADYTKAINTCEHGKPITVPEVDARQHGLSQHAGTIRDERRSCCPAVQMSPSS